ncbi:MAG: DUF1538 domain-containing protein [Magnetococcales bacterium]|nr:DUF1538 domain-containing protein [Magnetococcales bacterium]
MIAFIQVISKTFTKRILDSGKDLLPIIVVIALFQTLVLGQPIPDLAGILTGTFLVLMGLTFFIAGLELALFPIGEGMAHSFARKGSLFWLLTFSFCLGFSTTVAEPALIAVAKEAASIASDAGLLKPGAEEQSSYALGLRLSVAVAVGLSILIGILRILRGWPISRLIIGGYVTVLIMTLFAPREIVGIAFDSGGVTTSTVTVPLVTALGVGLASAIRGRDPMIDGFGLIAFASLLPMIFVMGYGILLFGPSL